MDENGQPFPYSNEVVIQKFQQITEIVERRYARADQNSSDLGTEAAQKALQQAGWNPEDLDLIIVGQNYGDIDLGTRRIDQLPSIASRIKHNLGIVNPRTVAFDVLAGCPGWIQGVLVANAYLQAGMAKKALVVGTETLSRIIDVHDRDSMIFADGAGATCLEVRENAQGAGILGFASATHTKDEAYYLQSQPSVNPLGDRNERFLRMKGRKIYEFALRHVPDAMKAALDHAGVDLRALARAALANAAAGRVVSGASTLTMQVVRMVEPRPRTLWSKCVEIVRARQLERCLDKETIASTWLTQAPMGGTLRGFEAAARHWFGRPFAQLQAHEVAALVAMAPAPSARAPLCWSEGFHPHPRVAFSGARPVAEETLGDYMDVVLHEQVDAAALRARLDAVVPGGFRVYGVREVPLRAPSLMSIE
jgi:3-oxoacyl-(acyl-carrier-protein) synthase III